MFRTPLLLASAVGLAAALAAPAAAEPACDTATAGVVHGAEGAAAATPAGGVTTPVIHGVVEPAACALPQLLCLVRIVPARPLGAGAVRTTPFDLAFCNPVLEQL